MLDSTSTTHVADLMKSQIQTRVDKCLHVAKDHRNQFNYRDSQNCTIFFYMTYIILIIHIFIFRAHL